MVPSQNVLRVHCNRGMWADDTASGERMCKGLGVNVKRSGLCCFLLQFAKRPNVKMRKDQRVSFIAVSVSNSFLVGDSSHSHYPA